MFTSSRTTLPVFIKLPDCGHRKADCWIAVQHIVAMIEMDGGITRIYMDVASCTHIDTSATLQHIVDLLVVTED